VPKQLYEFPDFPNTGKKWGEYPTGEETQQYILDFTDAFGLRDSLRLGSGVESVEKKNDGKWSIRTVTSSGEAAEECFDYVVMATGLYSEPKYIPDVPGKEAFNGNTRHTSEFIDANTVNGKRVVVVGGCKSAIDCALEAERHGAAKVTLLQRNAHWPTPRSIAWAIPFQYIFLSRFGQALVSAQTGAGALPGVPDGIAKTWGSVGKAIVGPVFKIVEALFALQFRLSKELYPTTGVVHDFYGYAHVLDYELRDKRLAGRVAVRNGEVETFTSGGLDLKDLGGSIECDEVLFGTGFAKDYSVFDAATQEALGIEEDGIYLSRHMLPAGVPNLAFVGEVATISNIATYGIQGEYLARMLTGDIQAPSVEAMTQETDALKAWKRAWMPPTGGRAGLVLLHQIHFHDQLLRDMGEEPRRKWPNALAEYLMPYEPMDYNGIIGTSK